MNKNQHFYDSAPAMAIRTDKMRLVRGASVLVDDVSITFRPGEFVSILGPNGAGKSSLLKLLTRETAPTSGEIAWDGRSLRDWSPIEMARRRAVLPQESALSFPFPVHEVVMLGRAPHLQGAESARDHRIVQECLDLAGITPLANRSYLTLSGGEKHRVHFARVLAQMHEAKADNCIARASAGGADGTGARAVAADTFGGGSAYLMLDEPTAALDLYYQHRVLHTAKKLCATGIGVITIVHDMTLAGRYADRIVLLEKGKVVADDTAEAVLCSPTMERVFGVRIHRHVSPEDGSAVYVASPPVATD